MATYATWNPSDKASTITLSAGDLNAISTIAGWSSVRSTISVSSGKWYWEYLMKGGGTMLGIAKSTASLSSFIGSDADGWVYYLNGQKYTNNTGTAYGAAYTTNDIIGVALDLDAGTVTFYKNGVSQGTAYSSLSGTFYAGVGLSATNGEVLANFGASAFSYAAPSSYNLGLYTGTTTTNFKKATVNASDVPATQTDFPAYVDLSRLGITTLAEAKSVRVYSDEAKTTELAREIVSASEMHVKIPSLTSTFVIYVYWDGINGDYAATDTYGRNAVWSAFNGVWHLENANDSTSNGFTLTNTGSVPFSGYLIGSGADFTPNDSLNNNSVGLSTYPRSFSTIVNWDALTSDQVAISQSDGSTHYYVLRLRDSDDHIIFRSNNSTQAADVDTGIVAVAGQNYKIRFTQHSSTSISIYVDGTKTNTTASTFVATVSQLYFGYLGRSSVWWLDGQMDEVRMINSAPSDNWETTEYNNQSDEPGFWGTWSNVGGGFTPKVSFFM